MSMTSRQRIQAALAHRQPDRLPADFGAAPVTGMHVSLVARLREHYGLAPLAVRVIEPYQMLGEVDDELAAVLGVDTVRLGGTGTMFGFNNEGWREWRAPWGQVVQVPAGFVTKPADDGGLLIFPQGDDTVPPCAHLPASGYFFDSITRQEPLDEDNLNVSDNLEEFGAITDAELEHFRVGAASLSAGGRAVVSGIGGTALGDIALVPAPFLKHPRGVRAVEQWYVTVAENEDFVREIFARQTDIAIANLEKFHAAVGDRVDVVYLCGTDFGTQISQFCSEEKFRSLWLPYYKRMNDWIHARTSWKTFKHTCGAVRPLLPALIDAGFDIVNPVQCSATGMEPRALKRDFGDALTFWGGGVDTQKTLPFGTPEQVRAEVLSRCEIFAPGGGFVFNSIHNLQALTPVANLAAMFAALREFNGQ